MPSVGETVQRNRGGWSVEASWGRRSSLRVPSWSLPIARWLRDFHILYFRSVRVYRADTADISPPRRATHVDILEARRDDVPSLASAAGRSRQEWIARQARGSVCFVARSGSRFQGFLWITRGAQLVGEVNHGLDVSRDPSAAYIYDVYVRPEARRQGIFGALLVNAKDWAEARGLTRLYTAVPRDNEVSERAHRAAGFTTFVGSVTLVRVGNREWKRVRRPNEDRTVDVLE